MRSPNSRPGRLLVAVLTATLAIFGGLLGAITWQLRGQLRAEVLRREAEAIHAVAMMQLDRGTALAEFGAEFAIDDLFAAVLESTALRGVLAVQLYDAHGTLRQAKPLAPEEASSSRWWAPLPATAEARYVARGSLAQVSPVLAVQAPAVDRLPLLDIAVPLHRATAAPAAPAVVGVARYWMDGAPVAREFARMDRRLARQAIVAFLGGAVLVGLVLAWAFSRLAEAHRRLEAQRADLARANEELDFAAKTGALGAISAHLIHGLKNPLAGLEGFVAETANGGPEAVRGDACRIAVETTRRLRTLVNEVATVLRDESGGQADYPVPVGDVVEAARARASVAANRAEVTVHATAEPTAQVAARTANLAGLVLANLVANAIEASPRGAQVTIEARCAEGGVAFHVRDAGRGIPSAMQTELFRPVRSAKRGGSGVGLAISLRLAKHAGGNLELVRSDAQGTEFRLWVPALRA